MNVILKFGFILILFGVILRCAYKEDEASFSVFGKVEHPEDNPYSKEKVELGKKLFFDKRLSLNNQISCASCHDPNKAFTDGKVLGEGVEGRIAMRNSPSLINIGFSKVFMFDGEIKTLEEQTLVPILDHNEMGASMKKVIEKLKKDKIYQNAAKKIFKRDFDVWVLTRSIACYERTLVAEKSNFDRYYYDNKEDAISSSAKRGWKLFSGRLNCIKCHAIPYFTDFKVHNNGRTHLNTEDKGRFRIDNDSLEIGFFKVPSLRNISITAPYMHDGSIETLDDVIEYYAKGGEKGLNQEKNIRPFSISLQEKKDLIAFLKSLKSSNL